MVDGVRITIMRRPLRNYWKSWHISGSWGFVVWHLSLVFFISMMLSSCASTGGGSHSDLVIGVVDPQRILEETLKGQRLTDDLNAFMKDRQLLVELEQKELRDLEEELRAQRTVLSQSAKQLKEEKFRQKMGVYQQKVADLNREVQDKQRELQNEFRRAVGVVVSQIANDQSLGLVIEHGANSGTLYHQESWDISAEVIQALNQNGENVEAPKGFSDISSD
jgi:outer membrane protein